MGDQVNQPKSSVRSAEAWPWITRSSNARAPRLSEGALCAKGASLGYPRTGAPLPGKWDRAMGLSGNAASSVFSHSPEPHGIRSGKFTRW